MASTSLSSIGHLNARSIRRRHPGSPFVRRGNLTIRRIVAEVHEKKRETNMNPWRQVILDSNDNPMRSYDYVSTTLRRHSLDNTKDGFYIAPAFMDKLVVHITKNFMSLPNVKIPLILGIWGGKGQGKSFQCELVFSKMGINPIMMSAGELESGNAGEPAKLIRQRYREAADIIAKGKMCCLFINDLDAGAGRLGGTTQYTVNNQMVNATLMNIADNPTNVQLPGMYNKEENARVPIIVTGNDFSTLYAPLIRDGRMEKFYWAPTREDRIGVCTGIFRADEGIENADIIKLVDTFPGQSIDFFGALRARIYDEEVRKWVSEIGVENIGKKLVNSKEAQPMFQKPVITVEKLLEYGKMLVQEQENVKRVQLADKYLSHDAALGDANQDPISTGNFYGQAAQHLDFPVPEGCTDSVAENFDPTARSDDVWTIFGPSSSTSNLTAIRSSCGRNTALKIILKVGICSDWCWILLKWDWFGLALVLISSIWLVVELDWDRWSGLK
ncbi:ATPase [Macleaya cordata]|uniref:Ribulose bisphosphate carboxylase/oxygenase activase, chloroplastic n=1 Tax=Macleaya cordata TaxID=56857 RepID=A0A200R8W6_MACCD|nr:ATPase [Macleaya cordata]